MVHRCYWGQPYGTVVFVGNAKCMSMTVISKLFFFFNYYYYLISGHIADAWSYMLSLCHFRRPIISGHIADAWCYVNPWVMTCLIELFSCLYVVAPCGKGMCLGLGWWWTSIFNFELMMPSSILFTFLHIRHVSLVKPFLKTWFTGCTRWFCAKGIYMLFSSESTGLPNLSHLDKS